MTILHPLLFRHDHTTYGDNPIFLRLGESYSSYKIFSKTLENFRRKTGSYTYYTFAADHDHPRLPSRFLAMFPACCERRRLCDLKLFLHSYPHDTCGLSGRDPNLLFLGLCLLFLSVGPPMMFRSCSDARVALGTWS